MAADTIKPPTRVILNAAPPESEIVAHVDAGGVLLMIPPPAERVHRICVLLSLAQLELLAAEVRDRQRLCRLTAGMEG